MATAQELLDVIGRINTATSAIATILTDLRNQISESMSPADVAAVKASLDSAAAALEGMATSPDVPVPVEPVLSFAAAKAKAKK